MDACDVCGFRLALWTDQDLERTLLMARHLAAQTTYPDPVSPDLAPLLDHPSDVHEVMHLLHLAGRRLRAGTPSATGSVAQISSSAGGVPKVVVPAAEIDLHGLVGDSQADRRNHGRPWQALCLWSAEVVDEWAADGHPLAYGTAGENLTLRGLDWAALGPGIRLGVGTALVQVTSYAIPCDKNARWFTDGGFRRLAHDVAPGRSRLYAAVLEPGAVSVGDAVVVEP